MNSSSFNISNSNCDRIHYIIGILNTTIPLVWVIIGTLTNGLSLFIFTRPSMRKNSTFFYLNLMTLSDFIVIWVGSFRDFLAYKGYRRITLKNWLQFLIRKIIWFPIFLIIFSKNRPKSGPKTIFQMNYIFRLMYTSIK